MELINLPGKKPGQPFLGIVLATNRPKNIIDFFHNLETTASDPSSFEVLVRVDAHDSQTIEAIKTCKESFSFRICTLVESNVGATYLLHWAYDKLIKKYASESIYFFCNLTDEIRMETQGWDDEIKKYIKYYNDDIFRLTFSQNKLRNYYTYNECIICPDNYPIITKRWLQITGGWGEFWGTDSWQQCIVYFLGKCYINRIPWGIFRSIPLYKIKVSGQEAGIGLVGEKQKRHVQIIRDAFYLLDSHIIKENFARMAYRLQAHITAYEKNSPHYIMEENFLKKTISVYNKKSDVLIASFNYGEANKQENFLKKLLAKKENIKRHLLRIYVNIQDTYFKTPAKALVKVTKFLYFNLALPMIYFLAKMVTKIFWKLLPIIKAVYYLLKPLRPFAKKIVRLTKRMSIFSLSKIKPLNIPKILSYEFHPDQLSFFETENKNIKNSVEHIVLKNFKGSH